MNLVMEEEVRHLAGERHEQRPDRRAHRWGKDDCYCVVDSQKMPLKSSTCPRRRCGRVRAATVLHGGFMSRAFQCRSWNRPCCWQLCAA
jgi:hypothetical protein